MSCIRSCSKGPFGLDHPGRSPLASAISLAGTTLQAERPITIVVPFGKGTTADLVATVVSEVMSKNIGQKITVELKPGEGGGIAMAQVGNAAPDGTTLATISQRTHVFNLGLHRAKARMVAMRSPPLMPHRNPCL